MLGTIHPKEALLLRVEVGNAKGDSSSYEMSLVNGHIPCVKSALTKKSFTLCWQEIIQLAVDAGIDKKD